MTVENAAIRTLKARRSELQDSLRRREEEEKYMQRHLDGIAEERAEITAGIADINAALAALAAA